MGICLLKQNDMLVDARSRVKLLESQVGSGRKDSSGECDSSENGKQDALQAGRESQSYEKQNGVNFIDESTVNLS